MQETLFSTGTPEASAPGARPSEGGVLLKAGDRFVFRGLVGQEPFEQRLPGSGSVGWVVEVISAAPWGSLGIRCAETVETIASGRVCSVGYADAVAMVRDGVWEPLSEQ